MTNVHPLAVCCWCGQHFLRGKLLDLEAWFCPTPSCTERQVHHSMILQLKGRPRNDRPVGGNKACRFVPLPRQVEAMDAVDGPATYILFGGARGGAKSKAMREIAHAKAMAIPNLRMILLRRTYKELEDNHLMEMQVEAPTLGAEYVPSQRILRYQTGSTLRFGHCETPADVTHYLSSEYDYVFFDELVTFELQQFLLISTSARTRKPNLVPKVIAGTNPGGPQSHWVRAMFVDQTFSSEDFPDYRPEDYTFIASKLEDNPYLDQQYEKKLLALPPELRRAYRDGDWDIFPGQYFPEWRKSTHISAEHRVYPPDVPRVLSLDWGFVKPGSCGWWALHDGHAYREAEWQFTRTTAFEVGKEIAARCKAAKLSRLQYLVYDTAMEIPGSDTGEPTIETIRRGLRAGGVGIATRPADKDRVNGWQRFRHWLGTAPDGTPWLQSSPTCRYFNRTIPALVSDETRPEDVDTDGEDHAADEARYFVMSRPTPGVAAKVTTTKEWSLGWLKQRMQQPEGLLTPRARRVA
jgi:hypothetical protein